MRFAVPQQVSEAVDTLEKHGFHAFLVGGCVRDDLLRYFSFCYPCEYPEPEALALLRRQGYAMAEADVVVRPRRHGVSTIGSIDTLYFALRVGLALVADRVRPVDRRFANPRGRKET